jgi:hypothetical protein
MITSIHVTDVRPVRAVRLLARPPRLGAVPGLLHVDFASAAPLRHSVLPRPQPGRVALFAFWETEEALDRFLADNAAAAALADGWHARLEPLRASGTWPGLPAALPTSRSVHTSGPVVVLTLARTRISGLRRFLAQSLPAERRACEAPGLAWGTALARPPFFSTCSLCESAEAAASYAYGQHETPHPNAIAADRTKPFHRQEAFVRFRALISRGGLGGRNPLPERWITARSITPTLN